MKTAVCINGMVRSFPEFRHQILESYKDVNPVFFIITDLDSLKKAEGMGGSLETLKLPNVQLEERRYKASQNFQDCAEIIEEYEKKNAMQFDWIVRHRTDRVGCIPPPNMAEWPKTPRTILVPALLRARVQEYGRPFCRVSDQWALMTRDLLRHYDNGKKETCLCKMLFEANATIWTSQDSPVGDEVHYHSTCTGSNYVNDTVHNERLAKRHSAHWVAPVNPFFTAGTNVRGERGECMKPITDQRGIYKGMDQFIDDQEEEDEEE